MLASANQKEQNHTPACYKNYYSYTNLFRRFLLLFVLLFSLEELFIVVADLWKDICRFFPLGREFNNTLMSSKHGSNSGAVVSAKMHSNSRAAFTNSTSLGSNPKSAYFVPDSLHLLILFLKIRCVLAFFVVVIVSLGGRIVGSMLWKEGGFAFRSLLLRNSNSGRNLRPPC